MDMSSWALIIATVLGVVLTVVSSITGKHFTNIQKSLDAAHSNVREATSAIGNLERKTMQFQIDVAKDYITNDRFEVVLREIKDELHRMADKLDKLSNGKSQQ